MKRWLTKIVLPLALLCAACSSGSDAPTLALSSDAGSTPGYQSGVPVTFADGTNVTTPDGSVVTTPVVKGAKPSAATTSSTVETTSATSVTAPKAPPALAVPQLGIYGFSEIKTPDDGGSSKARDVYFRLTSPDQHVQIRWQETDGSGAPTASSWYIESYDDNGLFATRSTLDGTEFCDFNPKAAVLPKSLIAKVGVKVETESSCEFPINDETQKLTLKSSVKSLAYEDLVIGDKSYRTIKIERNRVLKQGKTTITTAAREWYAFDLGIRIKVSDHTLTETDGTAQAESRELLFAGIFRVP